MPATKTGGVFFPLSEEALAVEFLAMMQQLVSLLAVAASKSLLEALRELRLR